jgi:hypothetical protein
MKALFTFLSKNRIRLISTAAVSICFVVLGGAPRAQVIKTAPVPQSATYRIGEKLTYNISFGKFTNAAYMETSVASRGKLSGQDAIELRSRIKTLGIVNATFYPVDEDRSVYVSPYTGLPLYVSRQVNNGPIPQETVGNYLTAPTTYFDILSLLYKAREMAGSGSYSLYENENVYTVVFQPTVPETVRTEAGEFDTMVSTVQSEYLTARGIKYLWINFSTDEHHLPVQMRLKTTKGEFLASLVTMQLAQPTVVVGPPAANGPPSAAPTVPAKPRPTATPYVENMPLSPELGFELGETLNYSVTVAGKPSAIFTLKAVERKQFESQDSLLLTATVTSVEPGSREFALGDMVQVHVDPDTLAPRYVQYRFLGNWSSLNQSFHFDRKSGSITFGPDHVDAPIGTHTLLSLLYAMRSFNLKPSKDPNNPVNDTRVAVFFERQPYVFTLRPSPPADIVVNGETISSQMVSVNTGNERMDKAGIKVWLAVANRLPVRMSYGPYEANLIPAPKLTP